MDEKASSAPYSTFQQISVQTDPQKVPLVPAPQTANCPRATLATISPETPWVTAPTQQYGSTVPTTETQSSRGWKRHSGVHLVQLSCSEQGHLTQVAQDHTITTPSRTPPFLW